MSFFMKNQEKEQQQLYLKLLQVTGSLSNIFSDSISPYLYYRAMENIFCKAFEADNLSRGDVSVDAAKNKVGIGLKTFLFNNGKTFQKIAEFNKESYLFRNSESQKLNTGTARNIISTVAEMRNERIDFTKRSHDLDYMIYHSITRSKYQMSIYEDMIDFIDIDSIEVLSTSKNSLKFKDKYNEYNFSLSKNTLFKRFLTDSKNHIIKFNIDILEDPFDFLIKAIKIPEHSFLSEKNKKDEEYIILPLYSTKDGKVHPGSGLNMWNAKGRKRDENEVYIPIPSWIHVKKEDFFPYKTIKTKNDANKTNSFEVLLPNKKTLSMKVTQDGGKALQSDPNAALGKWILREVLNIMPNTLITRDILNKKGVDSVKLTKVKNNLYILDFLSVGSYEDYYNSIFSDLDNLDKE